MIVIIAVIVYAYGFQVTKVNFKETRSEDRLTQMRRIMRALAKPNILSYNKDEQHVEAPIHVPCPESGLKPLERDPENPYLLMSPPCAEPGEIIEVYGYNLWPNAQGPINFIPPSGATLTIGNFTTDSEGYFDTKVQLPSRQPVEEAQTLRATARRNVGLPYFSDTAKSTWDKIIETVFLALLATTFGTLLAIPISFLAARNLMSDVKSSLTSIALSAIGWPLGFAAGMFAMRYIGQATSALSDPLGLNLGGIVLGLVVAVVATRWAMPPAEVRQPTRAMRVARLIALIFAAALLVAVLQLTSSLSLTLGQAMIEPLGAFGFLGNFVAQLGDVLQMATPALVILGAGSTVGGALGNVGQTASDTLPDQAIKVMNLILCALAGAILFAILGAGINWFYQIDVVPETLRGLFGPEAPLKTFWAPAGVGALLGLILAAWAEPKSALSIGTAVYYIVRTFLNATRSIEPLIMVIVFVVWVGIGPFAGALALALHTIAALAKLYSEQVESILPGPLEAVQATGATRLQTIVYAVVPQIIPPYISFTMYRWDINVRMSTIIGFAGGGGIGFLLQQNIRLLDYRAASVQMLAIAIVVASMDYVSSTLRERFV